jgi:predicted amidohydrolase YtcJ
MGSGRVVTSVDREAPLEQPVTIYTAATVHAQSGRPTEAFAVAGERVVATGGLDGLRRRFPRAAVRDFGAATVVPGLNDAHIHLAMTADDLLNLDLSHAAVGSLDGLLEQVRSEAARTEAGRWVLGSRFDDAKTGTLSRRELDAAAGPVPTLVTHVAGHWAVANSAALAAFGYDEASAPPAGGELGRDAAGSLDGRLIERAMSSFGGNGPVPTRSPADRLTGLRRAQQQWHAAGLTSICDAFVTPRDVALLQDARRRGALTLRTAFLLDADHYGAAQALGLSSDFGDHHLRFAGVKAFVDGAVGGRTCLLSEPFTGTGELGLQITETPALRDVIFRAHRDGTRVGVHANGDAAIRLLLDVVDEVMRAEPRPGLRHRIEHCSVVDDDILRRIKALDLVVAPFAGYAAYHGAALDRWYGPERVGRMFAHRSFLDAGITVAGSSDYPCGPFQPLFGIQSMVTRRGADDGTLVGGRQRITAAEALEVFTVGSAAATGQQSHLGRLQPGYLADFVVLAEDPLAVDPGSIAAVPVLETFVGGDLVWSAEAAAP